MVFLVREAAGPVFWLGVLVVASGKEGEGFGEVEVTSFALFGRLEVDDVAWGSETVVADSAEEGDAVEVKPDVWESSGMAVF